MDKFYIGMDIGATSVRFAIFDITSKTISDIRKSRFEKYENAKLEVDKNLCEPILKICGKMKKQGKQLAGIGISLPALLEEKSGFVDDWPNNKKWNGFPIKTYLSDKFFVPIAIEEDANSAALGEHLFGAGKGHDSLAYVTISSGIGCGLIVNNKLFVGQHGWAAELGHIRVTDKNILCTCGSIGCLQAVASGPAILKEFMQTLTYQNLINKENFDVKDIKLLADKNVEEARRVFDKAGFVIGKVIANLIMLFDISLVILGGGVIEVGEIILQPIREGIEYGLQNKREFSLICSQLKDTSGVMGALALINEFINNKK